MFLFAFTLLFFAIAAYEITTIDEYHLLQSSNQPSFYLLHQDNVEILLQEFHQLEALETKFTFYTINVHHLPFITQRMDVHDGPYPMLVFVDKDKAISSRSLSAKPSKLHSHVREMSAEPDHTSFILALYSVLIVSYIVYKRYYAKKSAWIVCILLVQYASMSCLMFSILRGAPPFYAGQAGLYFIHPRSGQQFAFEACFMGFLCFAISTIIYVQVRVAPKLKDPEAIFHFGLLLFVLSFAIITHTFRTKNPWY